MKTTKTPSRQLKELPERMEVTSRTSTFGSYLFELVTVFCVCIVPLILASAIGARAQHAVPIVSDFHATMQTVVACGGALLLVAYLAHQRGEPARRFGFRGQWSLIPASLGVFALGLIAALATYLLFWLLGLTPVEPTDVGLRISNSAASVGVLFAIRILGSAVYEEVIVRAYLMTRLLDLKAGNILAVAVSSLVQASYHTYQGFLATALKLPMFVVFSIFFLRLRNVWIVILAHLYFDVLWWIAYSSAARHGAV